MVRRIDGIYHLGLKVTGLGCAFYVFLDSKEFCFGTAQDDGFNFALVWRMRSGTGRASDWINGRGRSEGKIDTPG